MKYYPITITQARYGGVYEGGQWLAFYVDPELFHEKIHEDAFGSDCECSEWWEKNGHKVGKGRTPDEACSDLCKILDEKFGAELWAATEEPWVAYHKYVKMEEPWIVIERNGEQRSVTVNYKSGNKKKIVGWDGEWETVEGNNFLENPNFFLQCIKAIHPQDRIPFDKYMASKNLEI